LEYQKLEVICFTKKSLTIFLDYLNSEDWYDSSRKNKPNKSWQKWKI
jgi:hypothetical protein